MVDMSGLIEDTLSLSGIYDKIPVKTSLLNSETYEHLLDIELFSYKDVNEVDLFEFREGNKGERLRFGQFYSGLSMANLQ